MRSYSKIIAILSVAILLLSCNKTDTWTSDSIPAGEPALVSLSLKSSKPEEIKTRALTDDQENLIRTLHILIFKSDGTLQTLKYFADYQNATAAEKKISTYSGTGLTICAVANMADGNTAVSGGSALFSDVRSLSDFELKYTQIASEDINRAYGLVMSGRLNNVTISPLPTETTTGTLSLYRLAAKITIKVADQTPAGQSIALQSYKLCQLPVHSYVRYHTSPEDYFGQNPALGGTAFIQQTTNSNNFTELTTDFGGTSQLVQQGIFYMFENLRGNRISVGGSTGTPTDQREKAKYAPAYATYAQIEALYNNNGAQIPVKYLIYLGADNSSDYNIKRNHKYTYEIAIKGIAQADLDTRVQVSAWLLDILSWDSNDQNDLAMGKIIDINNSAIVVPNSSDKGAVTFDIRKCLHNGFTTEAALKAMMGAGSTLTADVLWQDGNVINTADIKLDKDNGLLTVKSSKATVGNAVVALYPNATKNQGDILWSWHVWVTDYAPDGTKNYGLGLNSKADVAGGQVHAYGAQYVTKNPGKVIMDRNLGATKTYYAAPAAGDGTADEAFGMFYQWGRKDPFPRAKGSTINATNGDATTIPIYGADGTTVLPEDGAGYRKVNSTGAGVISGTNTLAYAVKNPLAFIYSLATPFDWYTNAAANQNNDLWGGGAMKSPYDPCPKGWRVAPDGTWSDFTRDAVTALNSTFPYYSDGVVVETYVTGNYKVTNGRLYKVSTLGTGTPLAWYPAPGFRDAGNNSRNGALMSVGYYGFSWASSVSGSSGMGLYFRTQYLNPSNASYRAFGFQVRCIQE